MKKLLRLNLFVLLAAMLVSCARNAPESAQKILQPGDKFGSMSVEEHITDAKYASFGYYCSGYQWGEKVPGSKTSDCTIPRYPRIQVDIGWDAKDVATLEANWDAMTWELYIDGYQVNLDKFGQWSEIPSRAEYKNGRGWVIDLVDTPPGQHTLRLLWRSEKAIDDGFDIYAPGTYESNVNFTIQDK